MSRANELKTLADRCNSEMRQLDSESQRVPKVLVFSLRAWPDHNAYEAVIAQALRLRGADVSIVTCGGGLPACEEGWPRQAYPRPCNRCAWATSKLATNARLDVLTLAHFLPWSTDPRDAPESIPVNNAYDFDARSAALASTVWRTRSSERPVLSAGNSIFVDNAISAAGARAAAGRMFDSTKPDVVFLVNGMFAADQGILAAAKQRSIRTVTYEIAPRNGALVFSQGGVAPQFDMDTIWQSARFAPLSSEQNAVLDQMLAERQTGKAGHESYPFTAVTESTLREELGIPRNHKIIGLFSNIAWDTAAIDLASSFPSMLDFIEASIRSVEGTDWTLVIRSHPAEVKWGTDRSVRSAIEEKIDRLPDNVRFISAANTLDSYDLLRISNLVLAYSSTIGLEAAVMGKPVAVGASVHYANRGFTTELDTISDIERLLDDVPQAISSQEVLLARRYAFAFFFRMMISFPAVERSQSGAVTATPRDPLSIEPGADPFLDHICDSIVSGGAFDPPHSCLASQP